jgi:hypothetical protein
MSPGLAALNDKAAAAVPFARSASLLEELAGIRLTPRRAERAAEPATQIADLLHAREHLRDLAQSPELMLGDRTGEWLAARLEDPGYGHIDGITAAAREFPLAGVKKDEIDTAPGYFENNAPHALALAPPARPARRLRRHRGQLQDRPAPQAARHAPDRQRSRRHHRPRCKQASHPREAISNMPRTQTRTA